MLNTLDWEFTPRQWVPPQWQFVPQHWQMLPLLGYYEDINYDNFELDFNPFDMVTKIIDDDEDKDFDKMIGLLLERSDEDKDFDKMIGLLLERSDV
jgi:hypothetical protein